MSDELLQYIADYVNEELDRGNEIDLQIIKDAVDAYEGGADETSN